MNPEDQSNIPTKRVSNGDAWESPRGTPVSDSQLGGMLELGERSKGSDGTWQPPPAEELQHDFPHYEIRGILGRGGMGAVYKAWQRNLDRFVAIKILPPSLAEGIADFAERFKREAKAMAQLKHPGIVAVFDAGATPGGLLYFVMEFVEGESAQAHLKSRGRLAPAEAVAIAIHVATALDYAWSKAQLIHRDIKPDNIFLSGDGEVKLGDLGLAKSCLLYTSDAADE